MELDLESQGKRFKDSSPVKISTLIRSKRLNLNTILDKNRGRPSPSSIQGNPEKWTPNLKS